MTEHVTYQQRNAGLASSASGFCCLVYCLSRLFCLPDDRVFLSRIARQGSGSACRSMYGGFSKWMKGDRDDGEDSVALPVVDESYWPEMRVIILVANDQKKAVGSTEGMQQSLLGDAGKALQRRGNVTVPRRMNKIENAIRQKDFDTFAKITMKDSDDFHHVCAITDPPLHYMNNTSRLIVQIVNHVNEEAKTRIAAYTFDAGPNGVIYILEKDIPVFLAATLSVFPPSSSFSSSSSSSSNEYLRNITVNDAASLSETLERALSPVREEARNENAYLKYILATRVGPGPLVHSVGQ